MAPQPGSPLSSPTKNAKKQKLSGTLVSRMAHHSAVTDKNCSLATPLARGGTVRSLRTPAIRSCGLTLDRIPHSAPRGPSLNPRYPRVFANRPPRPFSNPMQLGSLPGHALPLLAPRPLPRRALSGAGGQTVQAAPASWKRRGYPLAFLAHHGCRHQLRGGLKRTILSVSNCYCT